MTNKEKYQRAFSVLHASDEFRMEVNPMKQKTRKAMPRLVAICAAVILVIGMSTIAYAADVGGIQRTIQIWLHGEQTDAVLDIQNGEYSLTYEGEDGASHEIAGGEKNIAVYLIANERAVPFYEKCGMKRADDVMKYNHIEWTEFTVT